MIGALDFDDTKEEEAFTKVVKREMKEAKKVKTEVELKDISQKTPQKKPVSATQLSPSPKGTAVAETADFWRNLEDFQLEEEVSRPVKTRVPIKATSTPVKVPVKAEPSPAAKKNAKKKAKKEVSSEDEDVEVDIFDEDLSLK